MLNLFKKNRKKVYVIKSGKHYLTRNLVNGRYVWREDIEFAIFFNSYISIFIFVWKMRNQYSAFTYEIKKHYLYPTRELKIKPDPIPPHLNKITYE